MAYNSSRSCNADLVEGMSDSKYKKVVRDRGGEVDLVTERERRDLNDYWYGIHEPASKVLPDGTVHTTPEYESTPRVGDYI